MEIFKKQLNLNDDGEAVFDMAFKYVKEKIVPKREKSDLYPLEAYMEKEFRGLAELGLFRLSVAEELGGSEMSIKELNAALLAASFHCASTAALLLASNFSWDLLHTYAGGDHEGEDYKELLSYLNKAASLKEEALIAYPLFYDVKDLSSKLLNSSGKINGGISSFTLAPVSDFLLVPVKTENSANLYLFSLKTKGIKISKPLFMHGLRQLPFADVSFSNVALSDGFPLGLKNDAVEVLIKQRNKFSSSALTVIGGLSASLFSYAKDYSLQRQQGGSFLIEKSVLQLMLSSLKITALESLQAAQRISSLKEELLDDASVLPPLIQHKRKLAQTAHYGIQLLGGYGYMRDYEQEKKFRDSVSLKQIFGRPEAMQMDLLNEYSAGVAL